MNDERFITAPLSGWLDLIRGLAALAVVVQHAYELGFYSGYYPFSMTLALNAVVVFFVLSGLVIATSVDRPGMDASRYAAARIARIIPVAWTALAISVAIALYCQSLGLSPHAIAMDPGEISVIRTLRAALFIDQSWTAGLAINTPWWSLSYEVWFYILFGLATWLRGSTRLAGLAVACLIAGPNVLLLLPVWLVGVGLARVRAARKIGPLTSRFLIIAAGAALPLSSLAFNLLSPITYPIASLFPGHSQYALGYLVLALFVAGGLAGLRQFLGEQGGLPAWSMPAVRWGANMSFSLYILHWPLLYLLKANGIRAGGNPLGFVAIVGLVVVSAAAFAQLVENRREPLRRWLEQLFSPAQRIRTSSSAIEG